MARYLLGENSARKLRALFNAGAEILPSANTTHTTERTVKPDPWTVLYSVTEGSYIVYLPPTALMHHLADALATARQSFTAATTYGDYWYKLDLSFPTSASSTGGTYQLVAEINWDTATDTALIGFKVNSSLVIPYAMKNIIVANLKYYNGDNLTREVEQLQRGIVHLNPDLRPFAYYGVGTDGGGNLAFILRNPVYKLAGLTRRVGSGEYLTTAYSSGVFPGVLALQTPASTSAASARLTWFESIDAVIADDSLDHTNLPLYGFDADGWIVADYRGMCTDVRWEA